MRTAWGVQYPNGYLYECKSNDEARAIINMWAQLGLEASITSWEVMADVPVFPDEERE